MATSRWQEIHDTLKRQIESGELPSHSSLPTELELAERWGVSRLTAHRALYELQRSGLIMRKRKVGTVVLPPRKPAPITIASIFFDVGEFFQGQLLDSIRGGFPDEFHLAFASTQHDYMREAQVLKRMSTETGAIVLFPTCAPENNQIVQKLARAHKPFICIDRYPEGIECSAVLTDNYGAARDALEQLVGDGHTRIAHLTDFEQFVPSTQSRLKAYQDTMEGISRDPSAHLRMFPYLAPSSLAEYETMIQMVQDAIEAMLARPNPPTAIFCLRDHYAAAAAEACRRLQVSIPDQLEILGFVDRPPFLLTMPSSVRRIRQDTVRIGRLVAERIQRQLDGKPVPPERVLVPALLPGDKDPWA